MNSKYFCLHRFWTFYKYNERNLFYEIGYFVLITLCVYILGLISFIKWDQNFLGRAIIPLLRIFVILLPFILENKNSRSNAILNYILPVSDLEKTIYILSKYIVVFPGLFFLLISAYNSLGQYLNVDYVQEFTEICQEKISIKISSLINFYFVQGVFLAGHLYFKNASMLKTLILTISGLVLGLLFYEYIFVFLFSFCPPSQIVSNEVFGLFTDCSFNHVFLLIMDYLLTFNLIVGGWYICYLIIKEREI